MLAGLAISSTHSLNIYTRSTPGTHASTSQLFILTFKLSYAISFLFSVITHAHSYGLLYFTLPMHGHYNSKLSTNTSNYPSTCLSFFRLRVELSNLPLPYKDFVLKKFCKLLISREQLWILFNHLLLGLAFQIASFTLWLFHKT